MNTSAEISRILAASRRVAVVGHIDPDGDTIGACFAVALALRAAGKAPAVFLERLGANFNYIPGQEMVYNPAADGEPVFDTAVCLDCAAAARMGAAEAVFRAAPVTICIDHHLSNDVSAAYNLICPGLSSTSEIVYDVLNRFGEITRDIATCLYTGIALDTAAFKHSYTSARTHEIAARLIEAGAPFSYIHRMLFDQKSLGEVRILKTAVEHLEFALDGRLAFTWVTAEDMAEAGALKEDLEHIVNFILNIESVEISVFAYTKADNLSKLSLRSHTINVADICAQFGGGGHLRAAGCNIPCQPREALAAVLPYIARARSCPDGG